MFSDVKHFSNIMALLLQWCHLQSVCDDTLELHRPAEVARGLELRADKRSVRGKEGEMKEAELGVLKLLN